MLRAAVMKFGIGKWKELKNSAILPTKHVRECYLQLQRLLGQQSLSGFMGLHVDIRRVYRDNWKKAGVTRKNGCIVNMGNKLT